ncbi:hypothetical protein GF376_03595 [Candidatus Peregrinibacteria bacterium]|nr:hypothetical protein [Candidatus Peregrinibacteria bacterium]
MNPKLQAQIDRLNYYQNIILKEWRNLRPETADHELKQLDQDIQNIRSEILNEAIIAQSPNALKHELDKFQKKAWLLIQKEENEQIKNQ